MDILIKGMEMPSDEMHSIVLVFGKDGFEEARDSYSALKIECITAVALPEHGRLISDTGVKALLRSGLSLDTDSDMDYVCGLIDGLPTIVEANNE